MSNLQHLIEWLRSDDPNQRHLACEELKVSQQSLPQETINALRFAANDSNPFVADTAKQVLAVQAPHLIPDGANEKKQEHSLETSQQVPRSEASRKDLIEIAIGFTSIPIVWLLSYTLGLIFRIISVLQVPAQKSLGVRDPSLFSLSSHFVNRGIGFAVMKRRYFFLMGMGGAYLTNIIMACFFGIENCAGMIIGIIFPLLTNSLGYPCRIWVEASPCFF